jgi:hypothetical protein
MRDQTQFRAAYFSAAFLIVAGAVVAAAAHLVSQPSAAIDATVEAPSRVPIEAASESVFEVHDLDDLSRYADQVAVVTIQSASRGRVSGGDSHVVQEHVVAARVDTPIKGVRAGQVLSFADGLYVGSDPSAAQALGADDLALVTEPGVLAVGQRAIIGLMDGEIISQAILPIDDGVIADTADETLADDPAVQGQTVTEAVAEVRAAVA